MVGDRASERLSDRLARAARWVRAKWPPCRHQQVPAAYRRLFDTPDGKIVLKDLAKFCRIADPTHVPGDPTTSALNEGARCVFLHVSAMCRLSHERWTDMIQQVDDDRDP